MEQFFENIPQELKKLNRWVCWKIEERGGKPTKIPINPHTGGNAMANNPETWGSFDNAIRYAAKADLPGIGFMFAGDEYVGVDIDGCRDPETGKINEIGQDIIRVLDSYTEVSQSGRGIHIICRGKIPGAKRRKEPVEMYETGRFFVMTGCVIDDAHTDIEERTEQLKIIYEKYIEKSKNEQKQAQNTQKNIKNDAFFDENEIIKKAANAKNGDLFRKLMDGNWKGMYPSQSEADLALCNILAFWTKDAGIIDRIFRRSGLYREKWDERHGESTYGNMTIREAISGTRETHEPKHANGTFPEPTIQSKSKIYTSDDLGRSQRFSDRYRDQVLWCQDMKSWLVWNGKQWEPDRTLKVHMLAKDVIERLIEEANEARRKARTEDESTAAEKMFKDAVKARSEKAIKSMLELSKSDLPITANELDTNPFLLNCQNGVVDLRTGKLRPHDPGLLMSKIAGANYEPGKKFELFDKFLDLITCGDAELAEYFQIVCGMAAIGKVFYEGIAIFYGTGQNGKSTFLNTISKAFGDYAGMLNPELLMVQRDGRQAIGLADIRGKRFVTAIEAEEGKRISSATLKQLASTDQITARRLYENPITFIPTHTLIMATNFLPKISSTDVGTWRRIAVVPFRASIEEDQQIKDYASILYQKDADAILSWIVGGAQKYIKNNFSIKLPRVVEKATKEYRQSEDWLGNFIAECCIVGPEFEEEGGELYEAYCKWCEKNGETYKRRPRDFAAALEAAGYEKRRMMRGSVWFGLKIIEKKEETFTWKYKVNDNFWNELPYTE